MKVASRITASVILALLTAHDALAQSGLEQTVQQVAQLLDAQDLAGAKTAAEEGLRAYPASAALHNLAGVIDAQTGAFASAESHFQTAITLAPRSPGPYENLGRFYQERSSADPEAHGKALRTYQALVAIDPTNKEGLYQLAFLEALAGRFPESSALLDRLPQELRGQPQVLAVLVADLAGQDDPKAATTSARLESHPALTAADVMAVLPAFDRIKDDAVPRRLLEALDRRGMGTPAVLQALGRLHARYGRFAESRATLERAAAFGVTVPLLMDLARAAFKGGDREGALGYLAHARSLEPNNAAVHFMFGIVCVELNLAAEAYESLKKAVALDPENPQINYVLGAVSTHRHDPAEAIPYFEKYVALAPDDPRGVFALGAARFYAGQFDAARDELRKVAARPETAAGAHYFLARIARQANDLETARREVEASLQAYPKYADAWAELGLIQIRTVQYAEAEQSLDKALALDPNNYVANVNLATLYSRTKDPRREAQAARMQDLQEKRAAQAQEFLRIIEVQP
jgi:tetratricopeptide (TPR) repeat protein